MAGTDFKQLVTPSMVREIFSDFIIDERNKGWCMLLGGKILTIKGRIFFDTREQAIKAFYNSYHWRAMRSMHLAANPNNESWSWWRSENRSDYWKSFKKALEENYGFKVVKL